MALDGDLPLWEPSDRQAEFLAAGEFEVLYGGAAGGGKTDGLAVDALCLQDEGIANPHHRAILFRRSYPELRDLIDRALAIYPQVDGGAKFNQTERVWTFSSGAKVEFGYLHADADRFRHRGRAWNYVGFDELLRVYRRAFRLTVQATIPMVSGGSRWRSSASAGGM